MIIRTQTLRPKIIRTHKTALNLFQTTLISEQIRLPIQNE